MSHNILIFTGHYGEGHKQAALAIKDAIYHKYTDAYVTVIDPAKETHPFLDSVSRRFFINSMKIFPSIYNYFYEKTRYLNYSGMMLKGLNRIGINRVFDLVSHMEPDVIVCTCPVAAGIISTLKEYGLIDIPTVTVITDHTVHSYWVYQNTDIYIVGSESVRQGLKQFGIKDKCIKVTGIPINPKFLDHFNQQALKKKYKLAEDLPTVLISGGGYGIIKGILSTLKVLEKIPFKIQLIITCGHNQRLYQRIKQHIGYSKHDIFLTGFVDYMEELMAVSDIMITKAGGLTVTEAVTMELPMLLYKPIGGQEQDNTKFLINRKAALLAEDDKDLYVKIIEMLTNPELITSIQNNVQMIQHQKNAASHAAHVILNILSKQPKIFLSEEYLL
ncbi:MGDG synthase family glycosyltransferase [Scopulibacillus cellulosilyticus]|uniref:Glycosyltransferase n=1 Tax=Scopulibacillus cellulosilyticus TaxID=2665665 RepID=A0ABW2PRK5_9BACL